ncbi:MAG: MotA/TolQ/ExbB proton channel family protein [Asticcacaulis sp.]
MLEHKKHNTLIAMLGAAALLMSAPTFAAAAVATSPVAAEAPVAAEPVEEVAAEETTEAATSGHGELTVAAMFMMAVPVVKAVMIGLVLASIISWALLVIKLLEFSGLNKATNRFLEDFRGARSIADINRLAVSDEHAGNPLADMAAVATEEIQLSKQAGLAISGEHRESTLHRASQSINAVQAGLAKRLSGGLVFLASTGSIGPFVGLFGTVYGIMNSFIGIANTNTTNLAVVAPGIAEALLATGIGLAAAIPAVVMYNVFNSMIAQYGTRSEQFVSELQNSLSRQLDKGA